MTTRKKFRRRVIELIHGLPYEEAIEKEYIIGCIVNYIDNNNFRGPWTSGYHNKAILLTNFTWVISDEILQISTNKGTCSEIHYVPKSCLTPLGLPITIGRVMKALANKKYYGKFIIDSDVDGSIRITKGIKYETEDEIYFDVIEVAWKSLEENGEECTDDDQSDETIEKLYNLIKK